MIFLILFAFLAGILTVASPCILPVLPALFSASLSGDKWRPLGVILGLTFSFSFFTLALNKLVQQFGFSAQFLHYMAIILIGFFGMVMILPYLSDRFAKATNSVGNLGYSIQTLGKGKKLDFMSGLILGIALGLIWTPCAGPILATITTLVATQNINFEIILMTLSYSLGASIPLLIIAYGGKKAISTLPFFSQYSERIRQFFGWIMLFTAIALAFNWDIVFQQTVLEYFPNIKVENNEKLQKELNKLRPPPVGFPNGNDLDSHEEALNPQQTTFSNDLPKLTKAPELTGITTWINTTPLRINELKGKIILIDFWTYSCINCIRTFPYLLHWNNTYKDSGLVIIGIHTPEFEFEKNTDNVQNAVKRFHITYPVALDNQYKTWQAYRNSYWPAHYLIDQQGFIRQVHLGEGGYLETENAIRSLLGKEPIEKEFMQITTSNKPMTSEIYLGYQRANKYVPSNKIIPNKVVNYSFEEPIEADTVGLKGLWNATEEYIVSENNTNTLDLNFLSNRVYLVLSGVSEIPIIIELDGKPIPKANYTQDMNEEGHLFVKDARKYDIIDLKNQYGRHQITLHIPQGIKAYAFTFGINE